VYGIQYLRTIRAKHINKRGQSTIVSNIVRIHLRSRLIYIDSLISGENVKKIFLILMLSILVSSCVFKEVKLSDAYIKNIRKVGLISLMHDHANLHFVGFTMFNNTYNTLNVDEFVANDVAYSSAKSVLEKKGLEVVELKADVDLIKLLYKNSYSSPDKRNIESELLEIAKAVDVDYVMVIYSNRVQDRIAGSAESNAGYGMFKRTASGISPAIYSSVSVDVIKVSPFESLVSSGSFAVSMLPADFWNAKYEDDSDRPVSIPEDDKKLISESLKKVVAGSVSSAIKFTGLTRY